MTKKLFSQTILVMGLFLSLACPVSADIIFALLPFDGNLSGAPGSLVGWGYSLANTDSADWYMAADLNSDTFLDGTPTLLFDFPVLAPGATVTEAFDPVSGIGLFQLLWDAGAPVGSVDSGNFTLSGEWWNGDPLNGGSFVATAPDIALAYSATVTSSSGVVPEPSTFVLMACGSAILVAFQRARKSQSPQRRSRQWRV
jgi:hypothetical protein